MIIKTIWPWGGLVPTIIEVTPQTVEITYRQLFNTSQQIVIEIAELHSVEVDSGPFFSLINFTYGYEDEKIKISYLRHSDALTVKNLIEATKETIERRRK